MSCGVSKPFVAAKPRAAATQTLSESPWKCVCLRADDNWTCLHRLTCWTSGRTDGRTSGRTNGWMARRTFLSKIPGLPPLYSPANRCGAVQCHPGDAGHRTGCVCVCVCVCVRLCVHPRILLGRVSQVETMVTIAQSNPCSSSRWVALLENDASARKKA